jgi:2-keto-4-pentenoate hydratase/2-oxohepta-3-ene-1,7-dioic acid hydratase in catechol pathway
MHFANVNGRFALLTATGAIDVATASHGGLPSDPQAAFGMWDAVRAWAARGEGPAVAFDPSHLGPPVPCPRQVFGVGMNYRRHAAEAGIEIPEYPAIFTKFPTSIAPPDAVVVLPSDRVDWEVELVVVVGREARAVPEPDGWSYVAGLTVGQDLSERTVQLRPPVPQFSLGKSFPGFGPIGPGIVTPDEFGDPDDLEIYCTLNGVEVQRARTSELIFPVPRLISELSAVLPLLPGDLIFTGTPSGIGAARRPQQFLRPGDELLSTIEGIGTIRTSLVGADELVQPGRSR